ncbi:hypothetical protein [Isoptericola sp. 178]|uniref:hypothetical protein n=1 Tax=Isoptericola sp. 178 TaxID=3064651 RepID=UPI00271295B0|nr:hypothetical protein [Isoptericola sp. 178]MDO8145931.1 hypothetical protein [Isoptericola sp. 178]
MTTTTAAPTMTARVFLLDDGSGRDTAQVLGEAVRRHGIGGAALQGVRRATTATREAVGSELAAVADGLLDLDLGDVLLRSWRSVADLTAAGRRTALAPGEEIVALATHRITATHHPRVDLSVDGVPLHRFTFEISLVAVLTGVAAVVAGGSLVAVRGGSADVTGTLSLDGVRLVERSRTLDVEALVRLRRPIPLTSGRSAVFRGES